MPTILPRKTISPLQRHRYLSGLRQYDIAKAIGRPPSWLSSAERGILTVPDREARLLSKILKTSVEELFPKGDCGGKK